MHKKRASRRYIPTGPVSVQRLYTRSVGIMQARFELAFRRDVSEKTALDAGIVSDTLAGKSKSTKSLTLSQGVDDMGVTRSLQSLSGWRCRYTRFSATMRPRQGFSQRWGPRLIPVIGCAVNISESARRLSRLHLTRWPYRVGDYCPEWRKYRD